MASTPRPSQPIPGRIARSWSLLLAFLLSCAACSPESVATSNAGDASNGDVGKGPDGATLQKLSITSITPARGSLGGGEQLDLAGSGVEATSKVFVGDSEAAVQWRAGTTHIFVTAPAAKSAGLVDVRVGPSKTTGVV